MATGQWEGAEHERALAEGTVGAGGALVPAPLSARVIDLARNRTVVMRAGAQTVPMTSNTLALARLTSEGTPAWKSENATITAADMVFDRVTFTARTLVRTILLSVELFEDADPSSEDVIANSFAGQMAVELDRVALLGTGTPPEPRGVLNQSGVTSTAHGANGTAITNYDWWLDAIGAVRAAGFEPTSHIQAPRSSTSLSKLKETSTLAYQEVKQEVADVLRARWKALGRGSWDGRDIAVLGNGAKFRPLAIAPEESQFIQTQKFSVATIARFYGVPPEMVAGETAGHEAYTSPEMRGTDFLTFTLRPWLARIERAVSGLLPSTQRAKFNAGGFLRATLKEQYEALAIGVGAGIVMPNEARGKLDLPALPGLDRPAEPPEGGAVA